MTFTHSGKTYTVTHQEDLPYKLKEETYLVEVGDKSFELFIRPGDTHWSTHSDLIDPEIVEMIGRKIEETM